VCEEGDLGGSRLAGAKPEHPPDVALRNTTCLHQAGSGLTTYVDYRCGGSTGLITSFPFNAKGT